jgi:hypothetical protein
MSIIDSDNDSSIDTNSYNNDDGRGGDRDNG